MIAETAIDSSEPSSEPAAEPAPDPVQKLLQEFAAREDLHAVAIGFWDRSGKSGVRMTPMALPQAGHLATLFKVRVEEEYRRTLFAPPARQSPVSQGVAQGHKFTPKEVQVALKAAQRKHKAKKPSVGR